MTISRWILLKMRNVSEKRCRENQNTHFMISKVFPTITPFMRSFRKIWWRQRPQMTSQCGADALHAGKAKLRARTACKRPRAQVTTHTHTHTNEEYLLLSHSNSDSPTRLNAILRCCLAQNWVARTSEVMRGMPSAFLSACVRAGGTANVLPWQHADQIYGYRVTSVFSNKQDYRCLCCWTEQRDAWSKPRWRRNKCE